jgi:hypothetical protein
MRDPRRRATSHGRPPGPSFPAILWLLDPTPRARVRIELSSGDLKHAGISRAMEGSGEDSGLAAGGAGARGRGPGLAFLNTVCRCRPQNVWLKKLTFQDDLRRGSSTEDETYAAKTGMPVEFYVD